MATKRLRFQRPGDSMYVMAKRGRDDEWVCLSRCATPKAAMPSWRAAVRMDNAEFCEVEMVCGSSIDDAREQAELQYAPKREMIENPTCRNCDKPVASYGVFCNEECRESWEAMAGMLSKMNDALRGLPTKRSYWNVDDLTDSKPENERGE